MNSYFARGEILNAFANTFINLHHVGFSNLRWLHLLWGTFHLSTYIKGLITKVASTRYQIQMRNMNLVFLFFPEGAAKVNII